MRLNWSDHEHDRLVARIAELEEANRLLREEYEKDRGNDHKRIVRLSEATSAVLARIESAFGEDLQPGGWVEIEWWRNILRDALKEEDDR